MPASNDNTILDTIRRDSETGFRMLVRCYREPVYWHIRRITVLHHDAEDAMQETFLRVFRNIGKFNRDMPLAAWIFLIATNEALRQREKNKTPHLPLDDATTAIAILLLAVRPAAFSPATGYAEIAQAFDDLSEADRTCLLDTYQDDIFINQ